MKRFLTIAILVAIVMPVMAQKKAVPLKVEGDTQIVVKSLPFKVVASPGSDVYVWSFPDNVTASEDTDGVLTVTKAPKGVFRVSVVGMKIDFETKKVIKDRGVIEVIVGDAPQPDPQPDPTPPPTPAPIPDVGFRVLIIEDAKNRINLPPEQFEVLFDEKIQDYLDSKCVKESSGTKAWRIWPDKVNAKREAKYWQDALARKRDSLPWIIISDGKTGYEGPLPKDVDATLALLKKYGG